jgi:hypothetical protein
MGAWRKLGKIGNAIYLAKQPLFRRFSLAIGLDSPSRFWETPASSSGTLTAGSTMLRSIWKRNGPSCSRLGGALLAVVACLFFSGCTALRRPDYDFSAVERPSSPAPTWSGELRPADRSTRPFGVSNQALQIEQDFGVY